MIRHDSVSLQLSSNQLDSSRFLLDSIQSISGLPAENPWNTTEKNGIQQISAGVQKKFCLISLLYRLPSIYKNIQLLEFSFSVGNYWNYEPALIGWDSTTQKLKSVQMPPVDISCSAYGICWTPSDNM